MAVDNSKISMLMLLRSQIAASMCSVLLAASRIIRMGFAFWLAEDGGDIWRDANGVWHDDNGELADIRLYRARSEAGEIPYTQPTASKPKFVSAQSIVRDAILVKPEIGVAELQEIFRSMDRKIALATIKQYHRTFVAAFKMQRWTATYPPTQT